MGKQIGGTREQPKRLKSGLMAAVPSELLAGRPHRIAGDEVELIDESFERDGDKVTIDGDLLKSLFEEALDRGDANNESDQYALDRWLAPRLHLAIRVPRRVASDRRFWAWIAMRFGYRYVHERFADESGTVSAWRLTGDLLRNGVSRLWWAAEMLRKGPDYSVAETCLKRVVTAQYALELKYSWFRPAAIAFVNVAEGSSPPLSTEMMTELSKRANTYLPLMPIEALGYDGTEDTFDSAWWTGSISLEEILDSELADGPSDGLVGKVVVGTLEKWFSEVLDELHEGRRNRKRDNPKDVKKATPVSGGE